MDPREYLFSLEKFGIKFGLANIRALTSALGEPQTSFRSVLIAGTNGKGSVTAMVDTALRAAGLSVGRYTSPHLIKLEERFTINGEPVAAEALDAAIAEVRILIDDLIGKGTLEAPPTFFEVTTAIAFELFRRAGVAIAVLEVGLGGRLDSTNSVDPMAVAVTSIDFDHEQYLGNTLAAIAAEKAGVIRGGIPVIAGPLAAEARSVIMSACEAVGARFVEADSGARVDWTTAEGRTSVRIRTPTRDYGWIQLGLRGEHQVTNALVATRLLEELESVTSAPIDAEAIATGLRSVRWPGRLQMVEAPGGRRALLDAAHNPAGAFALASYLRREFPGPLPIVFGAMRDKDVALMLKALLPVASVLLITEPSNARAYAADEISAIASALSPTIDIEIHKQPGAALERAWTHCPVVCAAGSIFLIGDLLSSLGAAARDI